MLVRQARAEDAEEACRVVRRSIAELCQSDHKGDAAALERWLSNKTADNMRRWIDGSRVCVAIVDGAIAGVGSITSSGEVELNYVSPDFRFRGVSKAVLRHLEAWASQLGVDTVTLQSTQTARQLYLAAGYRESGPTKMWLEKIPAHPMSKRLTDAES